MRTEGVHNFPAMDRVVFGKPAAKAIAEEVERLGVQRVFLMVSRTLNTRTDEIEKLRAALGARYVGTYFAMPQHTTRDACVAAATEARAVRADLIVAVGGGSVIDAAKIVPMLIEHEITSAEELDAFVLPVDSRLGQSPFRNPRIRMIAVPSTLNGGEFNAAALVTDTKRKHKQIFFHQHMMPISIIFDPELAMHAPRDLWFGSGTRAMDHGIEALCSKAGNPLVDEVVLAGIRYLHDGMLRTQADPEDLEARRSSQIGTWLSAFGIQARVPMGASHGIGHVLGGTCGVPHYFCTPVLMPSVLRFNSVETGLAQARLAEALRAPPGVDAASAFESFIRELGLPGSLAEVNVGPDRYRAISAVAINHRFIKTNPRPIGSEEDIIEILEMAA